MYELGLKAAIENHGGEESVSGGFVFPSGGAHAEPFVEAGLMSEQTIDTRFPTIKVYYASISEVMAAYVERREFSLVL